MTWAKTALENTEAEALAEDEYKRRKPHVNSKDILALEKEIVKLGKKQSLKTWIVAPGIVYHAGESMLHHYLKVGKLKLDCMGERVSFDMLWRWNECFANDFSRRPCKHHRRAY